MLTDAQIAELAAPDCPFESLRLLAREVQLYRAAAANDARRELIHAQRSDRGNWMQTYTGGKFYPLDPRADEVNIADVAHGLAMTCRYGGHTQRFYSVAEHAVLVSLYVAPEFARQALLHDSSEAYIGDMIRPLKHTPEMSEFRRAEAAIELAVFERFHIHVTDESHAAVKAIDNAVLVDEIGAFMARPDLYQIDARPLGAAIPGLTPAKAEYLFMSRFAELFPEELR